MVIPAKLNRLYEVYLKYKDNLQISDFANDYGSVPENKLPRLKCLSKLKIRALGSIIKINLDSDEEEIRSSIINFWFELRAEWIRHNTVNNYNMVLNGISDPVSVVLSAFISSMIDDVENLLTPDEITQMNEIMVNVQNGF